ncbi:MAG: AAA family ATPase [Polyangiaceae bacterium]|nr:AAA family ATPase [Polyangiaceae bacterium]
MIDWIFIENYRSVGEETFVDLARLTALVGPNASGKSNIADVLRFLAESATSSLSHAVAVRHGFRAICREGRPLSIGVGISISNNQGDGWWNFFLTPTREEDGYQIGHERAIWSPMRSRKAERKALRDELLKALGRADDDETDWAVFSSKRKIPLGFERKGSTIKASPKLGALPHVNSTTLLLPQLAETPLAPLLNEIRGIAVYSLFPNTLRAPQNPNPIKPMTSGGDNWASTLKSINKSTWGSELVTALGRITGDIDDYRVTPVGGFLIPEFRHGMNGQPKARERWLGAAQESDGTLRIAAILTALFQEPPPSLIGFEEPELSVHPGALPILFDFLKEASTRSQILFTTHSPDLLDLMPIDGIRVVERHDGITTVAAVDERQRDLVKKRLITKSDLLHAEGLLPEGARRGA